LDGDGGNNAGNDESDGLTFGGGAEEAKDPELLWWGLAGGGGWPRMSNGSTEIGGGIGWQMAGGEDCGV
jgi:hypothetical protein